MKTLLSAALIVAVSSFTTARGEDTAPAPNGDLAKLQGKWTAQVGPEKQVKITLTIKDQNVVLSFPTPEGDERELKGEIRIDEKAKPHKTIDWVKFVRPDGQDAQENHSIYELDGDSFKLCSGGPGNERPTEFKAGEGGPPNLIVLTREK